MNKKLVHLGNLFNRYYKEYKSYELNNELLSIMWLVRRGEYEFTKKRTKIYGSN
jgi:hypothetical protein